MMSEFPVYLTLGTHAGDEEVTPALINFRDDLARAIDQVEEGKVAVLMEYTNHSYEAGLEIQQKVLDGARPSDAIIENQFVYNKKRRSKRVFQELAAVGFADGFTRGYRAILDGAFNAYPDHLILQPEWAPEEEINQDRPAQLTLLWNRLFFGSVSRQYEPGYELFRQATATAGNSALVRERRLAGTLLDLTQQQPDVRAAVSYFGTMHTGLSRELRAAGFLPQRYLEEKFRLPYFSMAAIARYIRFKPDSEIPERFWRTAYDIHFENKRLRRSSERGLLPAS